MERNTLRPLKIAEAKSTPAARLDPCRSCDLEPATCDKQLVVAHESMPDTIVLCGKGKGWVRRLEKPIRLDRLKVRMDNNLNGELNSNREALATAEAAL